MILDLSQSIILEPVPSSKSNMTVEYQKEMKLILRFDFLCRGCAFPMVISPAFRMGQYRVNDHPYHAPQFSLALIDPYQIYLKLLRGFSKKCFIEHHKMIQIIFNSITSRAKKSPLP